MVPEGWERHLVGKICSSIVPGRNKPKCFDGDIPWVTTPEIDGKYLPSSKQKNFIAEHEIKASGAKLVPAGSVVMAAVGELGLVAIAKRSIVLNQQLHAFVPGKQINEEYLAYWLSTQRPFMMSIASKTTIPYLNKSNCESIPVLTPPLPEQKKIAQILSTWDTAITTTEQLLANSQQQKKALMQQLLTGKKRLLDENGVRFGGRWERVSLGELLDRASNGVTYDSKSQSGLPVTRIETISTGEINFDKVGFAPDTDKTRKHRLMKGDILYSHINSLEHIGRVAYYDSEIPLYHGMNLMLLRANKSSSSLFIFHLLNSFIGKHLAKRFAKSAVNQASISTTDLKSFNINIPAVGEQKKIASVLSKSDSEIHQLKEQLTHLRNEKKALMQQLLTGKRRVKVDEEAA